MNTVHDNLQRLLVERIHHEDSLLAQRTYNYLTLNVFLGAVFALSTNTPGLGIVLALAGAVLGAFQIALGHRADVTLAFYREYLSRVEESTDLRVHRPLFKFYKTSFVETPVGWIRAEGIAGRKVRAANETLAWRALRNLKVLGTTNSLFGVIHPLVIGLIWAFALFQSLSSVETVLPFLNWFAPVFVCIAMCYIAFIDKPSRPAEGYDQRHLAVPPNQSVAGDNGQAILSPRE